MKDWTKSVIVKLSHKTDRKEVSKASYKNSAEHIYKYIGQKRISDVTIRDVQKLYNTVEKEISPYSAIQVSKVLAMAFKKATESKMIKDNPTLYAKKPKKPVKEQSVYTMDEIGKLLNALHDPTSIFRCLYLPVLLCVSLGLRRGEVLGLKWSDFTGDVINISEAKINNNLDKTVDLADVKTHRSMRPIAVGKFVSDALAEQKAWQRSQQQKFTDNYIYSDFICTIPGGMPMKPNYLSHRFDLACKATGLPHIRFHDLRHTMASVAAANDIDIKKISSRLGHSSISITADTYTHLFAEVDKKISNKIESAIQKATKKAY